MPEGLYTIKDLARELDVGESTVRFWRDRFSEFMSSVTQGKRKLYREEVLEALRFIKQESNRSKSAEQIRDELSRQQPIDVEPEKSQRSSGAVEKMARKSYHSLWISSWDGCRTSFRRKTSGWRPWKKRTDSSGNGSPGSRSGRRPQDRSNGSRRRSPGHKSFPISGSCGNKG